MAVRYWLSTKVLGSSTETSGSSSKAFHQDSFDKGPRQEVGNSLARDKMCETLTPVSRRTKAQQPHTPNRYDLDEAGEQTTKRKVADGSHINESRAYGCYSSRVAVPDIYRTDLTGRSKTSTSVTATKTESEQTDAPRRSRESFDELVRKLQVAEAQNNQLEAANQELEDAKKEMVKQVDELKKKNDELEKEIKTRDNQKEFLYKNYFIPYGKAMGLSLRAPGFFDGLLKNALKTDDLRKQAKALQEIEAKLKEQLSSSQGQVSTLQQSEEVLKQQVHLLQQQLFSAVEKVNALSDEQITTVFRQLAGNIKTLSRNVRAPGGTNILDIEAIGSSILVQPVNPELWLVRGHKKCLIEAFIWSVLLQYVFCNPLAVFGSEYYGLGIWWRNLFGTNKDLWPEADALAERWRYTTVERMAVNCKDAVTHGVVTEETRNIQASIMKVRQTVYESIRGPLSRLSPATDFNQIGPIIDKAFTLALDMATQRCRLQVIHSWIGEPYVQGTSLHLKSVLDNEDLEEGCVAFVINPGLMKWGDAQGKNLDQKLVLVPTEVFIEPIKAVESQAMEDVVATEDPKSKAFLLYKSTYKDHPGTITEAHFNAFIESMSPEDRKAVAMAVEADAEIKVLSSGQAPPPNDPDESPSHGISLI